MRNQISVVCFVLFTLLVVACSGAIDKTVYNVKDFGAKGDSLTIDSPAINLAITAASETGGGTVYIPKGIYSCYSIRLASNIKIKLEEGAVLKAAQYTDEMGFDLAEPNDFYRYQDFGHSHWKNSLIWGIGLQNVTICGKGKIDGELLSDGFRDLAQSTAIDSDFVLKDGVANKAIALKECKNVIIKDITIDNGGHFCILATGVDNMTISGIIIDSERDGIDIDCCKNVVVENCTVNTPWDDAIVMKTSYALGYYADCDNISISGCNISGYEVGTILSGERLPVKATTLNKYILRRSSGRIKCGTESSGNFKNISITDCTLEYCGGLHIESTDGALIDNISYTNVTLRECVDSPIFIMIGSRLRSPEGCKVGSINNISFNNIKSYETRADYGVIITGYKDNYVSDIEFCDIYIQSKGGFTKEDAIKVVPEIEKQYPDPKTFGIMPSAGMYLRHVRGTSFNNVDFAFINPDTRPLIVNEDCI